MSRINSKRYTNELKTWTVKCLPSQWWQHGWKPLIDLPIQWLEKWGKLECNAQVNKPCTSSAQVGTWHTRSAHAVALVYKECPCSNCVQGVLMLIHEICTVNVGNGLGTCVRLQVVSQLTKVSWLDNGPGTVGLHLWTCKSVSKSGTPTFAAVSLLWSWLGVNFSAAIKDWNSSM